MPGGVVLRPIRKNFVLKNCTIFKKGGITVLQNSRGQFYTSTQRIFRPYDAYEHPYVVEGLRVLGAITPDVERDWKLKEDQRSKDRATRESLEDLARALRELKLKPSQAQLNLMKKHKVPLR